MKINYKIALVCIFVLLSCCVTIGSSYALWTVTRQGSENTMTTGCFELALAENSSISLTNAYPIPDEQGLALTPYTFTLTNNCTIDAKYVVTLNTLSQASGTTSIPLNNIKYSMDGTTSKLLSTATPNTEYLEDVKNDFKKNSIGTLYDNQSKILATGSLKAGTRGENVTEITPGESKSYKLWLWIDYDATTSINGFKYNGIISVISSPLTIE